MKNIFKKSLLIFAVISATGFAFADTNNTIINNVSNLTVITEYKCKISESECVVDKIKYIQSGNVYFDAECNADHMSKSYYESSIIQDVRDARFRYCTMTTRTLSTDK